jgi:hypothetical protein
MVPNLADNIKSQVDNFKIENFITLNEVEDYIGKLPGIETIMKALGDIFSSLKEFADKIMSVINSILDMFDISGLFDALGLGGLKDFIFGLIDNLISGGTLSQREGLNSLFSNGCSPFNTSLRSQFGFGLYDVQMFTLSALISSMICNGISSPFSKSYEMFKNSDMVADGKMSDDELDKLFSKSISQITMTESPTDGISLLEDIASIDPASSAKIYNGNLGNGILDFLDRDTANYKNKAVKYTSFMDSMNVLDNGFNEMYDVFNLSRVKGKNNFISLARSFTLEREVTPNLDNPIAYSVNMDRSILSLF